MADFFLKFDGSKIKGESTAEGHVDELGIASFSWGASNPVTVGSNTGGLAGGKVSISSFNFMMEYNVASPMLFAACASGQHFPTATFVARRATGLDGGQKPYLTITFTDVMIESYQSSGSDGGGNPSDSVSIAFAKIKVDYQKQASADGKMDASSTASWDLTAVKK